MLTDEYIFYFVVSCVLRLVFFKVWLRIERDELVIDEPIQVDLSVDVASDLVCFLVERSGRDPFKSRWCWCIKHCFKLITLCLFCIKTIKYVFYFEISVFGIISHLSNSLPFPIPARLDNTHISSFNENMIADNHIVPIPAHIKYISPPDMRDAKPVHLALRIHTSFKDKATSVD